MKYDTVKITDKIAIIGDVHGCHVLLLEIIAKLENIGIEKFVFLGDLVDRGPQSFEVVQTVSNLVTQGRAISVIGNHDWKLLRFLDGKDVRMGNEQLATLKSIGDERLDDFKNNYINIFKDMNIFLIDEENRFIISHAISLRPKKVHDIITDSKSNINKNFWTGFLYGKSESHALGVDAFPKRLPISYNSEDDMDGWKSIVGHYHTKDLYLENGNKNVICVDFCAGEGGRLAALTFTEQLTMDVVFSDSYL
jgi:protein phosphatase